ncbi:hypothetical protein GRI72_09795 [Altererythrobacter marinus]|uniref:Lipoprotein n=1 Tax=Pelagerythrobacter marinus TaxID=538382 RepID=A0ABW9UZ22_9SPHN|nr:hypothetical protein [Pelagerythrobacter marinus]MXO69117.1 hypothetical protein [Pelagerythrobacter marinus]
MIRLPALLALPALAACGGAGQGERVEPAPALAARCGAQAEPIFHCTVADGRVLSVCVATGDGGVPRVRYSFGRGAAHLVLPTPEGPPPRFATVPYSGGGEAQIAFDDGPWRHVVFSRMVRTNFTAGEPNYPAIRDGLVVLREGRFAQMHVCQGGAADLPIQYEAAGRAMTREDELFTEETARADAGG